MDVSCFCPNCEASGRELARKQAVIDELVACKELRDRIDAADLSLYSIADAERANDMQAEYDRRKPLAWSAARREATPKGKR